MNKYSSVPMFINQNYGWTGEPTGDLRFFWEYLLNHKDEIPKILELLEKLEELGFDEFEFNEDLDFTKETYNVYQSFNDNFNLTYVANPQVIPNYASYINFKTEDSNYKMKLGLKGYSEKEICEYGRKVVLNSLLFDLNTLPEKLDIEHTHSQLVILKNEQKEQENDIRNSADLDISISGLEYRLFCINSIISKLEGIENKEQLLEVLSSIKDDIEKLRKISTEYNNSISEKNELLTPEFLEEEKKLYLKRREWSSLDFH